MPFFCSALVIAACPKEYSNAHPLAHHIFPTGAFSILRNLCKFHFPSFPSPMISRHVPGSWTSGCLSPDRRGASVVDPRPLHSPPRTVEDCSPSNHWATGMNRRTGFARDWTPDRIPRPSMVSAHTSASPGADPRASIVHCFIRADSPPPPRVCRGDVVL